jgi:hypothetical protein
VRFTPLGLFSGARSSSAAIHGNAPLIELSEPHESNIRIFDKLIQ